MRPYPEIPADADVPAGMFATHGWFFRAAGEPPQQCLVEPGHALVAIMAGAEPRLMNIPGPGLYEIDCPLAADDMVFPVLLLAVENAHVQAFLNMSVDQTAEAVALLENQWRRTIN